MTARVYSLKPGDMFLHGEKAYQFQSVTRWMDSELILLVTVLTEEAKEIGIILRTHDEVQILAEQK